MLRSVIGKRGIPLCDADFRQSAAAAQRIGGNRLRFGGNHELAGFPLRAAAQLGAVRIEQHAVSR